MTEPRYFHPTRKLVVEVLKKNGAHIKVIDPAWIDGFARSIAYLKRRRISEEELLELVNTDVLLKRGWQTLLNCK